MAVGVADTEMIARALRTARRTKTPIRPVSETFGLRNVDDAYAVQAWNAKLDEADGQTATGRKIGLTSPAVQRQLGVNEPDCGVLWANQAYQDGDTVETDRYIQPRVEAEIAFVLGRDLIGPRVSLPSLISAMEYALPAIEIVDSAIANWQITLADTVADNASAAGYVLGTTPRRLMDLDLRLCGMRVTTNGLEVSMGVGAACMGHPLNAVRWLAERMIGLGRPLKAGDLVLSGALGPMVPVSAGDLVHVEIQGFSPFGAVFG